MELERKCVTITWQIENIEFIDKLHSPVITIDTLEGTKWKLGFIRISNRDQRITAYSFRLTITREVDDGGPEEIGLHYNFSISPPTGSSSNILSHIFGKNQSSSEMAINSLELVGPLTADAITIQFKMWLKQGTITNYEQFFVKTRMSLEHCIFTERVENFSYIINEVQSFKNNLVTLKTISSSTDERMSVNLNFFISDSDFITMSRRVKMEIVFLVNDEDLKQLCEFQLFILDSSGNKTDTRWLVNKFKLKSYVSIMLPGIWEEELLDQSEKYLVDGALSLHCELTFCSGIEYENVERTECETDSLAEVNESDFLNVVEFLTSKENIPCDMKLQTDSVTFPAHTSILSAQSPVFDAMFKTDMKETVRNCVNIDNVDAETVKNMLVFLYSETLEDLEWKSAMKLYFAADKYQILTLKDKCTALLKQSLDLSNCCVLLHLTDIHQDLVLQKEVIKYIDRNHEMVVHCDQWKNLEKTLPHLVINFYRDRYLATRFLFYS